MVTVVKRGFRMSLSEELIYTFKRDPRYRRIVVETTIIPPSKKEWAKYREAKELWAKLENNPYFMPGGGDYGPELVEPSDRTEYVYAETVEEWLARCRKLDLE